jgi:hypothetical protein
VIQVAVDLERDPTPLGEPLDRLRPVLQVGAPEAVVVRHPLAVDPVEVALRLLERVLEAGAQLQVVRRHPDDAAAVRGDAADEIRLLEDEHVEPELVRAERPRQAAEPAADAEEVTLDPCQSPKLAR